MLGALSHMAWGLGEVGIRQIGNEAAVVTSIRENLREPGFYFFPGMPVPAGTSREQKQAANRQWEEKIRQGPRGILIYQPSGAEPMDPKQLLTELASNIAAVLVAAFVLARADGALSGFLARAGMVAQFGVIGGLDIHVSHWNWYGFPGNCTLATMVDGVIGWFLVGLVLAWRIRPWYPGR